MKVIVSLFLAYLLIGCSESNQEICSMFLVDTEGGPQSFSDLPHDNFEKYKDISFKELADICLNVDIEDKLFSSSDYEKGLRALLRSGVAFEEVVNKIQHLPGRDMPNLQYRDSLNSMPSDERQLFEEETVGEYLKSTLLLFELKRTGKLVSIESKINFLETYQDIDVTMLYELFQSVGYQALSGDEKNKSIALNTMKKWANDEQSVAHKKAKDFLQSRSISYEQTKEWLAQDSVICNSEINMNRFFRHMQASNMQGMQSLTSGGECFFLTEPFALWSLKYINKTSYDGIPLINFRLPNGREVWAAEVSIINK